MVLGLKNRNQLPAKKWRITMEIKLSNAEEKLKEIKDTDLTQLDDFALLSMKMQMEDCLKDPSATFYAGQHKAAMFIN